MDLEGVVNPDPTLPTEPAAPDAPAFHNPVLTRTHEPARSGNHSWIMLGALAVAVVAGAAFWYFDQTHPAGPLVNHAVAAVPATPAYATATPKGG
jgi:hypothetical protein